MLVGWFAARQRHPTGGERPGPILYELCVEVGRETFSEMFVRMRCAGWWPPRSCCRWGGAVVLAPVLADAASPMRSPIGPPDGVPAIDDVPSLFYVAVLATARFDRAGHTTDPREPPFTAMVIGADPPEACGRGVWQQSGGRGTPFMSVRAAGVCPRTGRWGRTAA
ncbi:hypothetical protein GCM10018793_05090 [Streptomyces sulfonofaciens]|uniref:Uncharacterized protein n=1 Tax=Streptomyces sulfonofaciens TaxID=68272 RepID=A0A919FS41_9ACTN|nr:hypothetical protein GCM10018793_05090 [Streptomyces sulfonofaciens]